MRKSFAVFILAACAVFAPATGFCQSVTMAWSEVGNPGNAADPDTGYGAVPYSYNIGTYDVTVSQYVAFLNSNDPTGANTLGLYNMLMSSTARGGVSFNAANPDGSMYSAMPGDGNNPINYVTFYDTLRFANWLDNGQKPGSTETGAYTLLGGTPTPSNGDSVTRNASATVFLPSLNEWYKAAYYNPAASSYYAYPTSSNTAPTASFPTAVPNSGNFSGGGGVPTPVGAYSGTTSPFGAYDMAGDVYQWNEELVDGSFRDLRGGSFLSQNVTSLSSSHMDVNPGVILGISTQYGFRMASILTPEPGALALFGLGAAGVLLAARRRKP